MDEDFRKMAKTCAGLFTVLINTWVATDVDIVSAYS